MRLYSTRIAFVMSHFRLLSLLYLYMCTCVCCVFRSTDGYWSEKGCELIKQYEKSQYRYVECRCTHLSTFALLMDMSNENVSCDTFE